MNLRAFLVLFYVVSFIFVTTPERRRLRELAKTDPEECSRIAHLQVKKAFRNMLRIAGVRIEMSGLDNIPDEPCLYVANHNSYVDILVSETAIPTGAGFVSKDSLQKVPGLSSWMYLIHCLFLNRSDVREGLRMINTGAEYLKAGYSMFIFPEGTRSKDGHIGEFKGGSLKMAQKAGVSIVPVAISGTSSIFEKNKGIRITPGSVWISFGKPFRFSELTREQKREVSTHTRQAIQVMLDHQRAAMEAADL